MQSTGQIEAGSTDQEFIHGARDTFRTRVGKRLAYFIYANVFRESAWELPYGAAREF
jgi:hypothetical protein